MTVKEYCESCQNKGSYKCHGCMGKYYDGVLQGKPTKYKKVAQTNADRIRATSDEELADWIARTQIANIKEASGIVGFPFEVTENMLAETTQDALEWLKQPAEVTDNEKA